MTQHSQICLVPESGDLDCGGGVWEQGTSGGAEVNLSVALFPELGRRGELVLCGCRPKLFYEQ